MLFRSVNADEIPRALRELQRLATAATRTTAIQSLLGIEGTAARTYFPLFATLLQPASRPTTETDPEKAEPSLTFDWAGRTRRPPTDPINACLSFAYSLLLRECTTAILASGLDPYLGVYHQPRYGKPALALDLMEEFRPLIAESVVLSLVNRRELRKSHLVQRGPACNLTTAGRRAVTAAFERRMETEIKHPIFGYAATYRRILAMQTRLFARTLLGEIPAYPPFRTR